MNPEELSKRLERLETQMGYSLGNQVSILEQQGILNKKLTKKPKRKSEVAVILNYFLLSLIFYGVLHIL